MLPNDNQFLGADVTFAQVAEVLQNAGLEPDKIELDFNPLVIEDGDRTVLIDTGFGNLHSFAGKLPLNLKSAGIEPEKITDVIISHAHPDHLSGAFNDRGELSFAKARHYISALDWDFLASQPGAEAKMRALEPQIHLVEPNAEIIPHITAIHAPGHTPGQIALSIESDGESLLFIGDAVHHFVISLAHPEWHVGKDADRILAAETRASLIETAARNTLFVQGYHFPFPGLGHILHGDGGFFWQARR